MGLVTVCKYNRTKNPFFIERADLNLYSVEELAYFLYHNICVVDRQLFDERLCRWLQETGCQELAGKIRDDIRSGTDFQKLVLTVAGASGFFSPEEQNDLRERLNGLAGLKEQERLKMRADELLNNRNEWAAAEEYRHILKMHQNSSLGMEFYSAVWNNLGVCYARQFLFGRAARCFETAYEYHPDEELLEQAELAAQLAQGILPGAGKKKEDVTDPQKRLLQWEREYRMRQKP
ncbi:MAG: hypothetical protein HFI16_02775 [Lachnospiraceae bacterium]|nr:hypothetical protein [Lachnospiraceae bacterium]